jgi:hypothetical protein
MAGWNLYLRDTILIAKKFQRRKTTLLLSDALLKVSLKGQCHRKWLREPMEQY